MIVPLFNDPPTNGCSPKPLKARTDPAVQRKEGENMQQECKPGGAVLLTLRRRRPEKQEFTIILAPWGVQTSLGCMRPCLRITTEHIKLTSRRSIFFCEQ